MIEEIHVVQEIVDTEEMNHFVMNLKYDWENMICKRYMKRLLCKEKETDTQKIIEKSDALTLRLRTDTKFTKAFI